MKTKNKRRSVLLAAGLSFLLVPAGGVADEVRGSVRSDDPTADQPRESTGGDPLSGEDVRPDERLAQAPGVEVQFEGPSPRRPETVVPPPRVEQQASQPEACTCPEAGQERAQAPAAAMHQVSGRIVDTKTVEVRGTNQSNLVVLIDTDRGNERLVADLGPVTDARQLNLRTGARIAIEGRVHEVADRPILVAERIRTGNRITHVDRRAQARQHAQLARESGERRASIDSYPIMP